MLTQEFIARQRIYIRYWVLATVSTLKLLFKQFEDMYVVSPN